MAGIEDRHRRAKCFNFTGYRYDNETGVATLTYDADGMPFEELIEFPWAPWPVEPSRQFAFYQALEILHLVAGVSYYKAGLAPRIDMGAAQVDPPMANFLNRLYYHGLAEFAYVNSLDLEGRIRFEATVQGDGEKAGSLVLPGRALVAMGGGKDSLVCLDLLQSMGVETQPVCVGQSRLIGETVKAAGLPLIRIGRTLSDNLIRLNREGAWNGHVPVTAINSAILVCAAVLYGYRYVVFANEASANEPTLVDTRGREVNHQFSKSFAFEQDFDRVTRHRVSPDIAYFSLLRPFSETAITRRFARLTEFHSVFSSCNRNFHQDGSRIQGRWCLDCPKCRFTALALAPFMQPRQLTAIQGDDLLNRQDQLEGFKALCGLGADKPFECVGSTGECRALVRQLAGQDEWKDHEVIRCLAAFDEVIHAPALQLDPDFTLPNCIPPGLKEKLRAPG
jgi:hypothetical protein